MQFNNLKEGLEYKTHCPSCARLLQFNSDKSIAIPELTPENQGSLGDFITKELDDFNSFKVNIYNNNIFWIKNYPNEYSGGVFYWGIRKECVCDSNYYFYLSCKINFDTMMLESISLNGENITCHSKDGLNIYKLRTIVSLDKLEYTTQDKISMKITKIDYPLMEINFHDPLLTIKRLDKLKPFL